MSARGHDVSDALTEVRTVLRRAETAMETLLWNSYRGNLPKYDWDYDLHRWAPTDRLQEQGDPDAEEMWYALERTVLALRKWRRTGKVKR